MGVFCDMCQGDYEASDDEKLIMIHDIIGTMNDDEIDDFGVWLYTEFFEIDDEELKYIFNISEVRKMVTLLGSDYFDEILDYIDPDDKFIDVDYFTNDGEINIDDVATDESEDPKLNEHMKRYMVMKNVNRKKKKFFRAHGGLKSKRRRDLASGQHRRLRRMNRIANKRKYRKNRMYLKSYLKNRAEKIDNGIHHVKLYR
jgi:hypothetical protein